MRFPVALLVALSIVSACGSGAAPPSASVAPSPVKLIVGYDGSSISTGPMYFTNERGIFKKYGLDVDMRFVSGGSQLTAALVGGDMPLAQNGYEPALTAALKGADIVIVGGISNKLPFQLVTKAAITRPEQLKGSNAKLAISRFGSSSDLAIRAILAHYGVDASKDVTILQIGGEPERTAALESGQIDGTVLQPPTTNILEKKGYRILANAADLVDLPNTAYATTRRFLKERRDVVKRFFKAMIEGIHEYKTKPDLAVASTATFLKAPLDEVKPAYEEYVKNIFPDVPRPTLPGIKSLFESSLAQTDPKAKTAKPEDYVDQSIFDELESEGFVKQILGR